MSIEYLCVMYIVQLKCFLFYSIQTMELLCIASCCCGVWIKIDSFVQYLIPK